MKKIMTWLLTMIVILSASVTAFAAEPDDETIDVYAKYVNHTEWNIVPVDAAGNGSTTLSDGTQITVGGAARSGWQLVIDPITEKDALDWIGGILDGKAKDLSPLHICFIDGCGNTKAADGVTVTVKLPEKLTDPVAYSLTGEGNASGLTVSMEDGSLTFTTDGSPYYVLGKKVSGGTSSTDETSSDPGDSRQTGDSSNLWLWVALTLVAVAGLTAALGYSKKRKKK